VLNKDTSNFKITKRLDIQGKVCPMTYVYTKVNLEKMNPGEILEVTLDFPAAIKNIPKSAKQQNLGDTIEIREIIPQKKWILLIRRF
jgi:tRNA 2-thiouridine synthesizing protein A